MILFSSNGSKKEADGGKRELLDWLQTWRGRMNGGGWMGLRSTSESERQVAGQALSWSVSS